MTNLSKALLTLIAILLVIGLGLFWPVETRVEADPFRMSPEPESDRQFRPAASGFEPGDIVTLRDVHSDTEQIRSGRFKYREQDPSWRFTTPIDWGNPHPTPDVQRAIQGLIIADPFLKSYYEAQNREDLRQAVFFLLDWQAFYQDGHRITPDAWEEDATQNRVARLAYILSEARRIPDLLPREQTLELMRLADFHVQRVTDPVYGMSQDKILDTPGFKALCSLVDLPACHIES